MKKIILGIGAVLVVYLAFILIKSFLTEAEIPQTNIQKQTEAKVFLQEFKEEKIKEFQKLGVNLEDWQAAYFYFISAPENGYYAEVSGRQEPTIIYGPNDRILPRKFSWQESIGGMSKMAGLPTMYNNVLYFVNSGCTETANSFNCLSEQYLEYSNDYGKSWQQSSVPIPQRIKETYFVIHNETLYHIYSSWCDNISIFPALGYDCGEVYIRKLEEGDRWSEPKKLFSTARSLLGVYSSEDSLMLIWQDTRFNWANWCGFIPSIGCVDGEPTSGPYVLYLGQYNVQEDIFDEYIIQNQYDKDLRLY